ncbi:MAG TPA: hypothetical protein VK666_17690 [Chryseolinea sp.]|nr:hypothetical protein [Chryseolinea sp.]
MKYKIGIKEKPQKLRWISVASEPNDCCNSKYTWEKGRLQDY